jgi:hypothetical protein
MNPLIPPATISGDDPAYFELRFRPCIELVSTVRRFVSDFYATVLKDADLASRLALATHELLENSVKYSTSPETTLRVEVMRATGVATVTSWNETDPAHIATITRLFAEMAETNSPTEYYESLLRGDRQAVSSSGLGLARVGAEALMGLGYEVSGSQVCIQAQTRVDASGQ